MIKWKGKTFYIHIIYLLSSEYFWKPHVERPNLNKQRRGSWRNFIGRLAMAVLNHFLFKIY